MPRDKCLQSYLMWCHVAEKSGRVEDTEQTPGVHLWRNDMSSRMKYGSAFTPVKTAKSTTNHPFSIKNLLNLDNEAKIDKREQTEHLPPKTARNQVCCSTSPVSAEDCTLETREVSLPVSLSQSRTFPLNPQWPAWVYATRYSRYGIPQGNYGNARRPRKPAKKQKQRPLFSQAQLQRMEEEFTNEKYISKSRRCKLATEVNLTEAQVRTWFQNRRTRWRKEVHGEGGICSERHGWPAFPGRQARAAHLEPPPLNCVVVRGYCSS